MKKLLSIFSIILVLIFSFTTNIYAKNLKTYRNIKTVSTTTTYTENKTITINKGALKASGFIPVVKNLKSQLFQYNLNKAIENKCNELIQISSEKNFLDIDFKYESFLDNDTLSIIIYANNYSSRKSQVATFVIDKKNSTYLDINSFLGENGLNYANKVIANKAKQNNYFVTPLIDEKSNFFVKNNKVYLIFGSGEIANVYANVLNIELPKENLNNILIPSNECYVKSDYNVKMVPLRKGIIPFGYKTEWIQKTSRVKIMDSQDNLLVTINPGRNSYTKVNRTPRQLEFASEVINGTTYVPISFFDSMMDLLFSVDSNGNVTISSYVL